MGTAKRDYSPGQAPSEAQLVGAHYRARQRIGHGRLGEIFAADDEGYAQIAVEHEVALQIIPEDIVRNNALFNRLDVGYSLLRNAAHPNIVGIRRFGRHGKLGYLAMELLEGVSLRYVLEDAGVLPPEEAKPVIRGLAQALRFLHANGILHGNLRTRNVFVTESLEVRLLDVLPLGADQATIRGGATSSPFSRCSTRDDIYGLACIAYEMLAGKHPFNHSPPAEAQRAGLEPDRIAILSDREWNALRKALSFDDASHTASVDEFVREFGITSADRLQPSAENPVARASATPAANGATTSVATLPLRAKPMERAAPATLSGPVAPSRDRLRGAHPAGTKTGPRRALLLALLLVTIMAWNYHGRPQADIAAAINFVEARVVPVAPVVPVLRTPRNDTMEAAVPPGQASARISEDAAAGASPESEDLSASGDTGPPVEDDVQAAPSPAIITVSEADGFARVPVLSTEYTGTSLVWWTREHSAGAGRDFVAVEPRPVETAGADRDRMLLVPLVNDSLAEPPESFFVITGIRHGGAAHIERIATVRIDIVDDD